MPMVEGQRNSDLVRDLGVTSQSLEILDSTFCQLPKSPGLKIISFYELKDTMTVKVVLVRCCSLDLH